MTLDIIPANNSQLASVNSASLQNAITMWASSTTDEGDRLADLLRDKSRLVKDFFAFVRERGKYHPRDVTPQDVADWREVLRREGTLKEDEATGEWRRVLPLAANGEPRELSAATLYAATSRVSSFYKWMIKDSALGITHNPTVLARPRAPKAYERVQALTDDELAALLGVVKEKANAGDLVARRDFALILFLLLTGHRRQEVLRLVWADLKKNGVLTVRFLNKGGDYTTEEANLACWDALVDYLRESGRLDSMTAGSPLWIAHDRSGLATGAPLTSHAFAKNLKAYASAAGLGEIHVHQLRHSFARMVGEDEGDLTKVQHALGHKNLQTTRVYLPKVTTKRDTFSAGIARRFNLNGE